MRETIKEKESNMAVDRTYEILGGILSTPRQIAELVDHPVFEDFFQSLWYNYLNKPGSTTSGPYWSDRFNSNKAFNRALLHLSKAGWIVSHTIPMRNWSTIMLDSKKLLQWVTTEDLINIRRDFKFNRFKLSHSESKTDNLTKTPKGLEDVGLRRPGITKSGNNEYKYDTDMLHKYYDAILLNTTKSIQKAINKHQLDLDGADYKSVAIEILDYHLYSGDSSFTMGESWMDGRGRAISSSLSKVFNIVGYKDARALIVGPEGCIDGYEDDIYLAIAELLGKKPKTLQEKIELGKEAYAFREFHNLDLDDEDDRADLYENIWLERIYDMFDRYDGTNWNVPIEKDFTASVIGIEGLLLGDYNMLDEVNIINPDELKDVWSKGMPRKQFKFASTPLLYGSTKSCTELWKKKHIEYTKEQVAIHNKELKSGVLGLGNAFKDYIINNVTPKAKMKIKVMDEEFTVYCNRYMNVGDYVKKYPLYDTASDSVLNVNHTHTNRIPDLEQFVRWFVTGLVHNLDSQVADYLALKIDWLLPIYDAFIIMPWDAEKLRLNAEYKLTEIYNRGEEILTNYFESIGIKKTNGSVKQWNRLMSKVKPVENFVASGYSLK